MLSVAASGQWNPLLLVQELGMGMPALVFVLLANWTTNDNLLYSSGLALTNVLPRLGRWKNTLLCGAAGTALAAAGLDSYIQAWLMLLSCVFSPLLGVALTDFFLVRSAAGRSPANLPAVLAVAAGIVLAKITPPQYVASAAGLAGSSVIYIILTVLVGARPTR